MNRLDQQAEQDLARADVRDEARAAEFADRANGSPEPSIPAAKPEARAKILRFIPASAFLKPPTHPNRPEERRAGNEGGSPCRSRWSQDHSKKKKKTLK